jgi:cysteine desulfurase family protein (TIGR01976 family)
MATLDPYALRAEFPALEVELDGVPVVYLDAPGGTQVPRRVIDAVSGYFRESNANHEGAFLTSRRSDETIDEARRAVADLLGAASPDEVKFGANMTTLTQHVSRSIAATLRPGDEVLVTVLDHEANVSPWRHVAADRGLTVRTVDIHHEDCTLDLDDLDAKLGSHTRLVAVGYASNATGTINPVREIVGRAHAAGALAYVDAVHYTPHGQIDVQDIDADFLVCSAYKWFGPHVGVLYGRAAVLDRLPSYKVRPAYDRFETGTLNHEGIAGTLAAVDYLASIGARFGAEHRERFPGAAGRVLDLRCGMAAIAEYERLLAGRLMDGLAALPGVRLWGIRDPGRMSERTPTFALTFDGLHPRRVAEALGSRGIFVWDGDFYAQALIERLGRYESGGVVRIGLVHYNTTGEVDRLLEALDGIVGRIAGGIAASA